MRIMKRDKIGLSTLGKLAKTGDVQALSRLLSVVEGDLRKSLPFLVSKSGKSQAVRLGITGPPGAGKSSLVNLLIRLYRKQNLRVGVLAVDPSSPFSGGALLGDRVRMADHAGDRGVFIRSLGSRGGLGGVSAATGAMARVLDLCGFNIVIIETVGVGQTELDIMNLTDVTSVVLVPESGDAIQTLKAGILEIADVFVVNKSDRPGAEALAQELKALTEQEHERRDVFVTSATKNEGVEKWADFLLKLATDRQGNPQKMNQRFRGELRNLVLGEIEKALTFKISKLKTGDVYTAFAKFKIPRI